MIAVRIPEEIRKYKEKIMFGLTARQLLSVIVTIIVCVPLMWFGRRFIPGDLLSWLIIITAVPTLSIGWIKINNMPMERFFMAFLKSEFLFPKKRKFKTENAFRLWQEEGYRLERSSTGMERRRLERIKRDESLERAFLTKEAEENGTLIYTSDPGAESVTNWKVEEQDLLTVRTGSGGKKDDDGKRRKGGGEKKDESKSNRLQHQAEEIKKRQRENPEYVPTEREFQILKKWNDEQIKQRKQVISKGKKELARKSKAMEKRKSAKTAVPRSTQQSIPYVADYDEGLFEVTPGKFSKMYRMKDINYTTIDEDGQVQIFCKLGEFLNYFSEEMRFSFCIDKRIISKSEQERKVFKTYKGDKYDRHRREYNKIIRRQMVMGNNDLQLQKFVTVTIEAANPIEALLRFHKIDAEIIQNLRRIGSDGTVVNTDDRLEYFHDKFRRGHEGDFHIDYEFIKKQGISSKDYIAPTYMFFDKNHFQIEDEFYRVLYLNNLPASLSDEFLRDIYDNGFPVTVSICVEPVAQDKGLKIVRKQLTGIEANKIEAEKRAIRAGYSPDTIQHSIKDAHAQAEELYDDMLNKNQKMFFVTILTMVHGNSREDLEENCKAIVSKARKYTCQMQTLTIQQEEGFKMALPFGYHSQDMCVERTLTTESTSIFMPFSNQDLFQSGGFYYGLNPVDNNLVVVNRTKMKTPSGFVLGSSGSGKSFATKREMLNVLLDDDRTNVLVIDPENEYGDFCRAFGGTVIDISSDSDNYINPMDMPREYGLDEDDDMESISIENMKDKAIKKKSEYILSIVERMLNTSSSGNSSATLITPTQRTIVDRCLRAAYRDYFEHDFDPEYQPTLLDLQNELDREKNISEDARVLAESVEFYTRGSMDLFSHRTNIAVDNRLIVFKIRNMGDQIKQMALIIIFDFIWNRMIENKNKGVRTYCYCDEIHVMFQSYYSADFLKQLYKRGRKYGLCITGLTQNVEDLLRSEQASSMINNSDFILMLNQNYDDLEVLSQMLGISPNQRNYVTGADPGCGLIFAEKIIVPFVDRFPADTYLYKLMSTRFGEDLNKAELQQMIERIMQEDGSDQPSVVNEVDSRLKELYEDKQAVV